MTLTKLHTWHNLPLVISLLRFVSLSFVVLIVKLHKANVVRPNVEQHQLFDKDVLSELLRHVKDLFEKLQHLKRNLEIDWRWLG